MSRIHIWLAQATVIAALMLAQGTGFAQQIPELPDIAVETPPIVTGQQGVPRQLVPQGGLPPAGLGQNASAGQTLDRKLIEDIVDARVKERLKEEADKKKAVEDQQEAEKKVKLAEEGYRIGSDLRATASFRDGLFLWLDTPNKDFTMHIGGWFQVDNVFWDQSAALRAPPLGRPGAKQGVASGAALGGIGDLQDGVYFRRIRPFVEGTLWENFEYRLILALENDQFSSTGLDEFWIAANNIPLIGTLRIGHVKTPMGFEADMTGSSRTMTFMERSSYSEAIELNQNFVTGIWQSNNYLDERATSTFSAFRTDNGGSSGTFFGDGQWGWQGRLTALPLYEADGRHFLHLGLSGGWRNGASNDAVSTFRQFQFRARPELRDDVPDGSPAATQIVPNSNSNRMIDTGAIVASRDWISGLEMFYVLGPLSLQAEYGWNWIDDVVGFAPAGFKLNPKLATAQNYMFNGGYIQLAYTLTGESRGYDRKYGILSRDYFGGRGPFTNAWLLWDENRRLNWGIGAWEVAARYSYTSLNNGTGLNRIQGGVMDGVSLGLNWYLNNNVKCQFDWVYDRREDLAGSVPGFTSGFGMRVQLSF
jgi:phosphate-selective porin OprO/OprP